MNEKTRSFFLLLFLLLFLPVAKAQVIVDTVKHHVVHDTIILKKMGELHSPRKAALFSTFLPGLGQVYNKKYWKVPVLYAGAFALVYSLNYCNTAYIDYRTAYRIRIENDPTKVDKYPNASVDQLKGETERFHRFRDLSLFGTTLLYVLNIVDASVDANLYTFDVSDDLSLQVQPVFINTTGINSQQYNVTGLSINLKF